MIRRTLARANAVLDGLTVLAVMLAGLITAPDWLDGPTERRATTEPDGDDELRKSNDQG